MISYFNDDFVTLTIEFDKDSEIEIETDYTCFEIFDSATYAQLGDSPECTVVDYYKLQISLGQGTTIEQHDYLNLAAFSLKIYNL